MDRRVIPAVGLGLLGLGAIASAMWFFRVDTEPQAVALAPTTQAVRTPATAPRARAFPPSTVSKAKTKASKRPRKTKTKTKTKAKAAKAPAGGVDEGELSEMAWARREFRQERRDELNERLDDYASGAGWDQQSTEEVRHLMINSMDRITRQLALVDNGQVSWHQHKHYVREFRERRADRLKEILGPDEFADFTDAMGFDRFTGEAPARGRLHRRQQPP